MQPLAYLLNVNAPHESPRWEQVGEDHKLGDNVVPVVPFSDYEALQKELGYSKMAADAEAEFANEYKAKFEALKAENEAQAKKIAELEAVLRIAKSEIDEAFKSEGVLFGNDPLVCKKIEAVLEALEESKLRQKFADKSAWTKLLKANQDTKKDEP